ncbi:MAG: adenylate/guanylate cyclase domain-containing protein, partial [Alphaproteobacteria bacterium]
RYASLLAENTIDLDVLPELDQTNLAELGIPLGDRKRLLKAAASLAGTSAETAPPEAPGQAPAPLQEAERRHVTVVFADLAGYTELSRTLDPEELHAILGRFFAAADRAIEDYGGTIDKHIGDCVMGVFGAPVSHGNDPERAVRAAIAVRDAMPAVAEAAGRPLGVHIGVAGGQVVASGTGSESHSEYTVTGEAVNLASRLTDLAERGQILVSDDVRRTLLEHLDCVQAGRLDAKGFPTPVTAWRLVGLREALARHLFVGREGELRQFAAALESCRDQGYGQTICVRGEAGIGKTRLVEEFRTRAMSAGFACHSGLVLDFGAGAGRDAVRALVRSLLDVHAAPVPENARAALASGLVDSDDAVFLNDLLDLPQPSELRVLYDAMENADRNRGKRETVARLVRNASRDRPLLLVIEDVHWADPLTLEHLAKLAETASECPALLVMTSRIEGDPLDAVWRRRAGGVPLTTVDLGPLRDAEAVMLVQSFADPAGAFARACIERAAGNPLFLEQLLRHAQESQEAGVPGSVQSLVQARMDRLAAGDKGALQAASVFGQRFSLDALRMLIDGRNYDCAALIDHGLVRPLGEEFLFAHALIREAVYASLLNKQRVKLHRRAADWFSGRDPIMWAEHLDRAADSGAPKAYLAAAQHQSDAYRYESALRLATRGLAIADDPADAFALTCFQGQLLHDLGRMPDSQNAYEAAFAAARNDEDRCRAWIGLASVKRITDDLDGAFQDLERAERVAETRGLIVEQARIHFLRGNLHFPRGEIDDCLAEHQRSLACAREAGSAELEAAALGGLGDAEYVRARMITAHDRFRRCIELCRQHGFGGIEVANVVMISHTGLYFRPLSDAVGDAFAAAEEGTRVGNKRAELNGRLGALFGLVLMAELERAHEQAELCLNLIRSLGAWRFEQARLAHLGRLKLAEGLRAEALDVLREARRVSDRTGLAFHGANIMGFLARALDEPEERRDALREGEDLLGRGAVGHNHLWFYPDAMETALELGDWDAVERYADALVAFTSAESLPWSDFFAARGRALAAFGRGRRDD